MRLLLCLFACLLLSTPAAAEDEPAPPPPQPESGEGPGGARGGPGGPRGRDRMGRRGPSWERLAQRFDRNEDGRIERDEVSGRAERMFDRLDGDGDGVLTKKDFDQPRTGRPGGPGGARTGRSGGGTATLSPQRVDKDNDKKISAAEWTAFHKQADQNGDGALDKAEWEAAVTGGRLRDPAPAVGTAAPKVSANRLGFAERIDLSKPKRTTVLIFGSHT